MKKINKTYTKKNKPKRRNTQKNIGGTPPTQNPRTNTPRTNTPRRTNSIVNTTKNYRNGDIYEGELKNDKRHGKGKMTYSSYNSIYEGEWKNDTRHGQGKMIYADGSSYEGTWKNNDIDGIGKKIYSDGDIYEGDWSDNSANGYGKMTYANGDIYEGHWKENKRHGKGKETTSNGTIYEGTWKNDLIHGKGKMIYDNADIYEGDWQNNKRYGIGKIMYKDGSTYEGHWKDDKRHGKGKMINTDSTIKIGKWENDIYITKNIVFNQLFSNENDHEISDEIIDKISKEEIFTLCPICSVNISLEDIISKNVVGHHDIKKENSIQLMHLMHNECYETYKTQVQFCNANGCYCPNESRENRYVFQTIPEIKNISLPVMEVHLHESCFIDKSSYNETINKLINT